jgi:hypothetical protein
VVVEHHHFLRLRACNFDEVHAAEKVDYVDNIVRSKGRGQYDPFRLCAWWAGTDGTATRQTSHNQQAFARYRPCVPVEIRRLGFMANERSW